MKNKSPFKTLMSGIALGKLSNLKMPLKRLHERKATISEIKEYILEAAKEAKKDREKEAAKRDMSLIGDEVENGWGDAELAQQIEFIKALDIKEMFTPSKKNKKRK